MTQSYSEVATWKDKIEDLEAIGGSSGGPSFGKTDEGLWYCSAGFEIKEGAGLTGAVAFGNSVKEAVEKLWEKITTLPPTQYLVRDAFTKKRFAFRWDGRHMFVPVDEDD